MTNYLFAPFSLIAKLVAVFALSFSLLAPSASAIEVLEEATIDRPGMGSVILDVLVARPLGVAATLGGSALFVATLPFSALGGNTAEAAAILVKRPAAATFMRCLGCTARQDENKEPLGTLAQDKVETVELK